MKSAASFDVFDTLLTRRVATPTSLFIILGDRAMRAGLIVGTASHFRDQRIKAEEEARLSISGREVTLEDIYSALTSKLGIAAEAGHALAQLEMDAETESITPVPAAHEMVQAARSRNAGIIFISDMYLPTAFIRARLEEHGFWQDGDRLYVSSEWKASKAEGSLFKTILEREQLRPAAVHHTGDRRDADFDQPLRFGMKASHLDVCRLTRYEEMLEEFAVESAGFSSLVAGTSRLARLQDQPANRHEATISEIAGSLISPIITFYALWLLREARKRGLQRLYFVARDGYLVKKVADALIQALGLRLESRYLYGSRQAWHLPAITDFSADSLSWLFEKTRTLTLRIVLGRLQTAPEDMSENLTSLGWPSSKWDRHLDDESLNQLREDLLGSTAFRGYVEKLVESKRETTVRYLEQEGLFDPAPWAIVDLGWHGRLQQSLEKLLAAKRPTTTFGLYFGLYSDSPALAKLQTASYLDWDLRSPPESKDIPSLVFLMESFCTAPHGSTVGYQQQADGNVIPKCRERGFEPLEKWGISTVHATVEAFAKRLSELRLDAKILEWDAKPALLQSLGAFSKNPAAAEARAWGAFPYEDEQAGSVRERLTKGYELTWENLRIALTFGDERLLPASWNVLWHGGQTHMLSMNNVLLRMALRLGSAKRVMGQLARRFVSLRVC